MNTIMSHELGFITKGQPHNNAYKFYIIVQTGFILQHLSNKIFKQVANYKVTLSQNSYCEAEN